MPKISINIDDNILAWYDRFNNDTKESRFTRTDVIVTDTMFYATLMRQGMQQVVEKLTYNEFVCLLGCFNGTLYTGRETPSIIKAMINDYAEFEPEFQMNSFELEVSPEQLLYKVNEFNEIQCYGLVEIARRFWSQGGGDIETSLKKIGIEKRYFAD